MLHFDKASDRLKTTLRKPEFVSFIDDVRFTRDGEIFQWKSRCHWDALVEMMARAYELGYRIGKLVPDSPEPVEEENDA